MAKPTAPTPVTSAAHTATDPVAVDKLYKLYRRKTYFAALTPPLTLFAVIVAWGMLGLLSETSGVSEDSFLGILMTILNLLLPIIVALAIGCTPIGIAMAFHYHRRQRELELTDYDERSGKDDFSIVPEEVKKWNWGAFGLGIIWGIHHGVWSSLLLFIPLVNFVYMFILGAKGSEWAWRKNKWRSIEEFKISRRRWNIAGIIALLVFVPLSILSAVFDAASNSLHVDNVDPISLTAYDQEYQSDIDFEPYHLETASYTPVEVRRMAEAIEQEMNLPQAAGDGVMLTAVAAEGWKIVYKYMIIDEELSADVESADYAMLREAKEAAKGEMMETFCESVDVQELLSSGIIFVHRYQGADSGHLFEASLNESDCI